MIFDIFTTTFAENTIGSIMLASAMAILGFLVKGHLANKGSVGVAQINANVSLGEQAIKVMVAAMEALRQENSDLKIALASTENHMERIIEYVLLVIRAKDQEEANFHTNNLEGFLKSIGKW